MESENCRICNRPLFTEASIKRGIGPICLSHLEKEKVESLEKEMEAANHD